ncbi:amino acid aminotransferase [Sphingomonas sp.]|uniref:amino acid aminotransferase n=1 Tax=Sphingomonas sp. TaxID=28214 RepID=UPI002DD663CE|nr:amino acid aminotransferase [Sphingomonas sp.]
MNDLAPITAASAFAALVPQPADALLALIKEFASDPRTDKLDLGVGVYRDEFGVCTIPAAVKEAERRLLVEQATKGYLGSDGDIRFVARIAHLVLGEDAEIGGPLIGVQTPGGGGALRLAAELYHRASPGGRIWIGTPTWPNHAPIFNASGVPIVAHPFYDPVTSELLFDEMMAALEGAAVGDAILIHGCCHNPTGAGFSRAQWQRLIGIIVERRLLPIVDLAYHGLGDGLDADAESTRAIFASVPDAMLAYSCDKNFALYRDRVGALLIQAPTAEAAGIARGNLLAIARAAWSMPPDHGAAVVRIILDDPELAASWEAELATMRSRINAVRAVLGAAHPRLASIGQQRGMFALLPLTPADVTQARHDSAIYMASDGRINIAGLREDTVPYLVDAIRPWLDRAAADGGN